MMKKLTIPESIAVPATSTAKLASKYWLDDACILDMDHFIKNLSSIKAKGVRPDLISSIIANYASKWLPDLSTDEPSKTPTSSEGSPESVTASWMKKRFFVETLVGILPPDDSVPCNFLLRLLRTANMVGVELNYRAELEKRISWQLDQASLKELMIPSFSHTCGTLLDVELVLRLVHRFMNLDEGSKSGSALVKVAKMVDSYLAEAALDSNLQMLEFITLAGALPSHARVTDDGLYRAIDTYLKVHPGVPKQERKILFRLIDSQKLSPEASFHAAQNERLPVRAVIQVLFSEQTKLNRQFEWSGSFNGARSPKPVLEPPVRCLSKRDLENQQMEIKKLREDVLRLQTQCNSMQGQIERLTEKKKGFLRWRKLAVPLFQSVNVVGRFEEGEGEGKLGFERQTPVNMKTKLVHGRTPTRWRKSMS
ncbi:NPH3 domain [Macleaya cordata]|uniref:NPH3 domain n=1 Tax=Macleaya cordata TaxID=56857 RepID=A0A200Q7U6_MACCD|nr:NPH3 domain [Macleaya cordata]